MGWSDESFFGEGLAVGGDGNPGIFGGADSEHQRTGGLVSGCGRRFRERLAEVANGDVALLVIRVRSRTGGGTGLCRGGIRSGRARGAGGWRGSGRGGGGGVGGGGGRRGGGAFRFLKGPGGGGGAQKEGR